MIFVFIAQTKSLIKIDHSKWSKEMRKSFKTKQKYEKHKTTAHESEQTIFLIF